MPKARQTRPRFLVIDKVLCISPGRLGNYLFTPVTDLSLTNDSNCLDNLELCCAGANDVHIILYYMYVIGWSPMTPGDDDVIGYFHIIAMA